MSNPTYRLGKTVLWIAPYSPTPSLEGYRQQQSAVSYYETFEGPAFLVLKQLIRFAPVDAVLRLSGQALAQAWSRRGPYYRATHLLRVTLYARAAALFARSEAAGLWYVRYLKWFRFRHLVRQFLAPAAWRPGSHSELRLSHTLGWTGTKPIRVFTRQYRGYSLASHRAAASRYFARVRGQEPKYLELVQRTSANTTAAFEDYLPQRFRHVRRLVPALLEALLASFSRLTITSVDHPSYPEVIILLFRQLWSVAAQLGDYLRPRLRILRGRWRLALFHPFLVLFGALFSTRKTLFTMFSYFQVMFRRHRRFVKTLRRRWRFIHPRKFLTPLAIQNRLRAACWVSVMRVLYLMHSDFSLTQHLPLVFVTPRQLPEPAIPSFARTLRYVWGRHLTHSAMLSIGSVLASFRLFRGLNRFRFGQDIVRFFTNYARLNPEGPHLSSMLSSILRLFVLGLERNVRPRRARPQRRFIRFIAGCFQHLRYRSDRQIISRLLVRGRVDGSGRRRRVKVVPHNLGFRSVSVPVHSINRPVQTRTGTLHLHIWMRLNQTYPYSFEHPIPDLRQRWQETQLSQ